MIDGFAGDICDITLTVTGGQNVGPPDPRAHHDEPEHYAGLSWCHRKFLC
ncbi:MAG: hypothetical protein R2879_09175 [Saprospiraceae bacterium]